MRWHTVDYLEREGAARTARVSRGFWLRYIPRPLILCRLFGHRPVVDGTTGFRAGDLGHRWVVCDRCGVRPDPQGDLDPTVWNIGDRYTGQFMAKLPSRHPDRSAALKALKTVTGGYPPGPWPTGVTGTLGGQIVIFPGRYPSIGFTLKVGNKGSEHTLAADFHLPWLLSLYLHTERFGSWLVQRLNPTGYESKVISVEVSHGRLYWRLWVDRDGGWSSKAPLRKRLRNGSVQVDPRTLLLGPKRYDYTDVGEPFDAVVRMPHGDDHPVVLKLQRVTHGRRRGRKRLWWHIHCKAAAGIPTKPGGRGGILGLGVDVSDAAVADGTWPAEAAARLAVRLTDDRRRYGWRNPEPVPA